jgi:hypothetical protein
MDRREALAAVGGTLVAAEAFAAPAPDAPGAAALARHNQWVGECLREIRSVRPGMTRKDLDRLFKPAGGPYLRTIQSFCYKPCPYFKISITFKPVDGGDKGQPADTILRVATPYLADPFAE